MDIPIERVVKCLAGFKVGDVAFSGKVRDVTLTMGRIALSKPYS